MSWSPAEEIWFRVLFFVDDGVVAAAVLNFAYCMVGWSCGTPRTWRSSRKTRQSRWPGLESTFTQSVSVTGGVILALASSHSFANLAS